ncbi:OB-fold domain-containing protein [Parahaliea sp. F7430]|uniref:OB-fold domain-containing protein n=1 Tax=Sediminihaliea albiluteola TaxID=2758564 RepID=A0A7W2YJ64_9GAMM|nr:OB-fold domain-containing protein [Sediminihaliea albiluteola]MBA6412777.1 OB-fold domain-containing protein [Sediminihaliea albiluteola]
MSNKALAPAIEGWHTMGDQPRLIGTRCCDCGTYFFPKQNDYCKNPDCDSSEFEEVELSRSGELWSYTNASYKPPAPFVAADPFEPFAIAAVQLEKEQMTVLGQVAGGIGVEQLKIGMPMELVLETLHETDDEIKVTWKWKPVTA